MPVPTISQYRAEVDELTRLANLDLAALWGNVTSGAVARELLADILPELVDVYGAAAATLAADWYDDLRDQFEVAGSFRAIPAQLPPRSRTDSLAGWAVAQLFSTEPDRKAALEAAQGGLQRIVADAGRSTVMGSSIADPKATGWQRSASGGCAFCQMLASRGAIYTSSSVDFGSHDHCRCAAVPAFSGVSRAVKPYKPTLRTITDADRLRTREWMAQHGY